MNDAQKAAFINAQAACALAEIAAMQAANALPLSLRGRALYTEDDFRAVPDRYGIHHNAVLTLFHGS